MSVNNLIFATFCILILYLYLTSVNTLIFATMCVLSLYLMSVNNLILPLCVYNLVANECTNLIDATFFKKKIILLMNVNNLIVANLCVLIV